MVVNVLGIKSCLWLYI